MSLTPNQRLSRIIWASRNRDKVREANKRWRNVNAEKVRRQAKIRMQRYRARHRRVTGAALGPGSRSI